MQRLEALKDSQDTWKDLMSAQLMSTEIIHDTGGHNLSPELVMNERHKMARDNSRLRHAKLFPIPIEIKFLEAKKLIRQENLQKLISQKEERIVTKAINHLQQSFTEHRNTVSLTLSEHKQYKKPNCDHKLSNYNNKRMKQLYECNQLLRNIKKIYESVSFESADKHCSEAAIRERNPASKNLSVSEGRIQKDESEHKIKIILPNKNDDKRLNTTPKDIPVETLPQIVHKELKDNTDKLNVSVRVDCERNLLYYWKVWRKFVSMQKYNKKHKEVILTKIDSFLERLTNKTVAPRTEHMEIKVKKTAAIKTDRSDKDCELNKIERDLKNSAVEAYECLQKSLKNFHSNLQPKVRALSSLPHVVKRFSDVEKKTYPVPEFLIRMETRYKERRKRWEAIQKRRDEIQAEKERIEREREEERLKMEEMQKKEKLEEIRERRRQRKEAEEERERERQYFRQQIKIANDHYTNYLIRRVGFDPWRNLMQKRRTQYEMTENLGERIILRRFFALWWRDTHQQVHFKYEKANKLYQSILLKNSLQLLITAYNDSVEKYQTAVDWWDAKLTEKAFQNWLNHTRREKQIIANKEEAAVSFCSGKIMRKWFITWTMFPAYMKIEKEKEKRKRIWQRKVQEFLPDYQPSFISEI